MSFAQSDNGSIQQLKERNRAKQMMKMQPTTMSIKDNSEPKEFKIQSRKEVKSSVADGVIRVKNGTPFIDIQTENVHRRMMPVNFPKAMAVDGQEIQFRYTVSDLPFPKNENCSMVINVYDIAIVKKR